MKRRLRRLEDAAASSGGAENEREREERLKMAREGAELCNDQHRRAIAMKRRKEIIKLKYRGWDFVRMGAPEDLSDEAMLAEGGDLPFAITKSGVVCTRDGRPVEEYREVVAEDGWQRHMEWIALSLVRGDEPDFTLDAEDTFWTLDGRFAVSPRRLDMRGLMGPDTRRMQEAVPPERWGRFLEADEEAADALERLFELANKDAPDNFVMSINNEWTWEEVDDFEGTMKPTALFLDAEEREATRRMTYVLIHDPGARAMLSKITKRRNAFAAAEGAGGGS